VGIGLFLAGVALVIVLALIYRHRRLVRQREMAAQAAKLGLQFVVDDPFDLSGLAFALFRRGDGRGCENVLWGVWEGLDLRVCDYWYYEESTDAEGHRTRSYHRFSCAIAALPLRCPPLTIGGESIFTRIADHIGFRDIEFESEEFNRAFNVKCSEPKFATDLIDARMMQWLLYAGKHWTFETSGSLLLCATKRLDPEELPRLAECIKAFSEHVPRVVHELYADTAGSA
jgi:hypothetical protein